MDFNITEHKWHDPDIVQAIINHKNNVAIRTIDNIVLLNESDAIAIAKHFDIFDDLFKLKSEQIKDSLIQNGCTFNENKLTNSTDFD